MAVRCLVAEKTGISVISGSQPNRAGRAGASPGRVFRSKRKTFRFPKTFLRISLISLPEATTLHPATENPTGSLAAPRTAGTLPEQPDHHRLAAPLPSRYVSQSRRCCRQPAPGRARARSGIVAGFLPGLGEAKEAKEIGR